MSALKENTGGLWLRREPKDQSAVKRNGHLHRGDHYSVRWWNCCEDVWMKKTEIVSGL